MGPRGGERACGDDRLSCVGIGGAEIECAGASLFKLPYAAYDSVYRECVVLSIETRGSTGNDDSASDIESYVVRSTLEGGTISCAGIDRECAGCRAQSCVGGDLQCAALQ